METFYEKGVQKSVTIKEAQPFERPMNMFLGSRLAKITILIAFISLFLDGINISSRYSSNHLFGVTAFTQHWHEIFSVSAGGTLVLNSELGNIRVETWPENKVEVRAEAQGTSGALDTYEMNFEQLENNHILVDAKHRSFFSYKPNFSLVYNIKVPETFNLKMVNGDGKILVSGLNGSLDLRSKQGNIVVENFEGIGTLETANGHLLGQNIKGTLSARSVSGEIDVKVFEGTLTATNESGKLSLMRVNGNVHATSKKGSICAALEGENTGAYFFSERGLVELQLPSEMKASVHASSEKGTAAFLPAGKLQSDKKNSFRKLEGSVNGGGKTIVAKSKAGNVVISM